MSLRTRLLLAFAVVVFVPLALLAFGFRFEVTRRLSEQYERQLDTTWAGVDTDLRGSAAILQQLERPKPERSLPKILSRAQVNQLIASPKSTSSLFDRDVAILELLYATGIRVSELCGLDIDDVELGGRALNRADLRRTVGPEGRE